MRFLQAREANDAVNNVDESRYEKISAVISGGSLSTGSM